MDELFMVANIQFIYYMQILKQLRNNKDCPRTKNGQSFDNR